MTEKRYAVSALKVLLSSEDVYGLSLSFVRDAIPLVEVFRQQFSKKLRDQNIDFTYKAGVTSWVMTLQSVCSEQQIDAWLIAIANELALYIYIKPGILSQDLRLSDVGPTRDIDGRPSN